MKSLKINLSTRALCLIVSIIMMFSMSITSLAAPVADKTTGTVVDTSLPAGFTNGYQYGVFNTYNSPAEKNGLGGTFIWFEGTISSVKTINVGTQTMAYTMVTDIYGNKWLATLDSTMNTPISAYASLYNRSLCFAGEYTGYSNVENAPAINCVKICDITTGSIWNSTVAATAIKNIPGTSVASQSNAAQEYIVNVAKSVQGRYYFTSDLKSYHPNIYVDVIANADGSISFKEGLIVDVENYERAFFTSGDNGLIVYKGNTRTLAFNNNLLILRRSNGKTVCFARVK